MSASRDRGPAPALPSTDFEALGPWLELGAAIRAAVRAELERALGAAARDASGLGGLSAVQGTGAGDVTFGIDVVAEAEVERWLGEQDGPLSLLTEDAGWTHAAGQGGFAHGGPRVAVDPIDGTRHLMHDHRPAWAIVSGAGPGDGQPRYRDLEFGVLTEIPDSRGGRGRELCAVRGAGALAREVDVQSGEATPWRRLRTDDELRLDRGYFPFFGFEPAGRARAQALASATFERLAAAGHIDPRSVLDDQYCSSGGQLALLALGTYRAAIDARVDLGRAMSPPMQTAKPYDIAGALLVAEEAGCALLRPGGAPLDFPMDTETAVDFAAYANAATRDAMAPAVAAALSSLTADG